MESRTIIYTIPPALIAPLLKTVGLLDAEASPGLGSSPAFWISIARREGPTKFPDFQKLPAQTQFPEQQVGLSILGPFWGLDDNMHMRPKSRDLSYPSLPASSCSWILQS